MTEPWWRPKTGDLIATVDGRTGEPCAEVIEVLQSGEAEEITVDMDTKAWCWSVHVRHLEGAFAGQEGWLALLPGEYVKVTAGIGGAR